MASAAARKTLERALAEEHREVLRQKRFAFAAVPRETRFCLPSTIAFRAEPSSRVRSGAQRRHP